MKRIITCLMMAVLFVCGTAAQSAASRYETVNGKKELQLKRNSIEKTNFVEAAKAKGERPQAIRSEGKTLKLTQDNPRKTSMRDVPEQAKTRDYKLGYVTTKSTKEDVATITFKVVGTPMAEYDITTGFHMILDADAEMYDYFMDYFWEEWDYLYDNCEYKIPENASADLTNPNDLLDDEASIDIPGGIYDFAFLIPYPEGNRLFTAYLYANGTYYESIIDDFEFKAGYEYAFTVEYLDEIEFYPEHDAALTEIILPPISMDLTDQEEIKVVLYNAGIHDIEGSFIGNVDFSYRVNGGTTVTETYAAVLAPGEELTYTFITKADFSAGGFYEVEAWADYHMDLNSLNNSIIGYTKKPTPIALPFTENFDDPNSLVMSWTLIDANGDGMSWMYNDWNADADGGVGALQIGAPWEGYGADDYLVSDPMIMPAAGTYHLTFYAFPFGTESLKVLYGTSSDPAEMEVLADYPSMGFWDYTICIKNFEITAPGNYYFAFHYYSHPDTGGSALDFDKVAIGEGIFVGVPDITFNRGLTPVSACDMTSEGIIGAEVLNRGTEPIHEFTLTYQVGSAAPVSQTFTQTIDLQEVATVYFNQKVDFSTIGNYTIKFTATTPNEENTGNNETEVVVRHYAPITELPFESDFYDTDDITDWTPGVNGGWGINDYWGCYWPAEANIPLLSRCITLEPDVYRFTYYFSAGLSFFGMIFTDDFYVTYGKSGTDPSTWAPVKEYFDMYTEGETIEGDIMVEITEPGEYVFAIVPTYLGDLGVFGASVSKVLEHDMRINEIVSPASFARLTPLYHASGEKTFEVAVENRGKTASESGSVEVVRNGSVLASQSFNFTEVGEVKNIALSPTFENLTSGSLSLEFNASIESGIDYSMQVFKIVSDSIFAWDNIEGGFPDGVGISGSPAALGVIYELQKKDILTTINLGLFEKSSKSNLGLAVYTVNDNLELGNVLFEVEHPRTDGNNSQGITFDVPDTELEPGKYYFELRQLDGDNIAVAYDEDAKGYFYDNTDNTGVLAVVTGFGYMHLRPNFGKSPVGIKPVDALASQPKLYPNPSDGQFKVETAQAGEMKISDLTGKSVYQSALKVGVNTVSASLPKGIYLVTIITGSSNTSSKLIVK